MCRVFLERARIVRATAGSEFRSPRKEYPALRAFEGTGFAGDQAGALRRRLRRVFAPQVAELALRAQTVLACSANTRHTLLSVVRGIRAEEKPASTLSGAGSCRSRRPASFFRTRFLRARAPPAPCAPGVRAAYTRSAPRRG